MKKIFGYISCITAIVMIAGLNLSCGLMDRDNINDPKSSSYREKRVDVIVSNAPTSIMEDTDVQIGIKLASIPEFDCILTISSSSTEITVNDEVSIDLVFTQTNALVEQYVTLDSVLDADALSENSTITMTSAYTNEVSFDVRALDKDAQYIQVTYDSSVAEGGAAGTIRVKLTQDPVQDLTVTLTSSIPGSLSLDSATVTFNSLNYLDFQDVTMHALEDSNADNENVTIDASTTTPDVDPVSFYVTTVDNNTISITSPANNSTVLTDANIVITFGEEVDTSDDGWSVTVGPSGSTIEYNSSNVPPLVSWSGSTQLTINPTADFNRGEVITVSANGFIANLDGYPFGNPSISFKIATIVIYDGNGADSGSQSDSANYSVGQTVTVKDQNDLVKSGYTFAGWNTQNDGKGTTYWPPNIYNNPNNTFTMGSSNVTLYAKWTLNYALRATGPGGGLVFYDKGSYTYGWRYMEAAASDQTSGPWGDSTGNDCDSYSITGADGTAIGTGNQNTTDIDNYCTSTSLAAHICINLNTGGYSDWFLPSKDELNEMYAVLKVSGVGGFADAIYWSSTESTATYAYYHNFTIAASNTTTFKSNSYNVRAIRQF